MHVTTICVKNLRTVHVIKLAGSQKPPLHDLLPPSLISQPLFHRFICLCSSEDSVEERLKQGGASLRKTSHCRQNVKVLPAGISLRFGTKSVFKQRTEQRSASSFPPRPEREREEKKKNKRSALTCLGFLLPLRVTFSGASTPALPFPSFLAQHLEADGEKSSGKASNSFSRRV